MTPQEIHNQLKKILDDLSEIDSSETFTQMLADNSFVVDDEDMGYLIHQGEQMLAAVNAYVKTNAQQKAPQNSAVERTASNPVNLRFASIPHSARFPGFLFRNRQNRSC
jgi:hypothetical protein